MNLETFTEKELLKLKEEIEERLYFKNDFWNAIISINDLERKNRELSERLFATSDNQPQIKKLKDLGFLLVIHEIDNIGLILANEKKINEKFVGCSFNKLENKLSFKNYEKPPQSVIDEIEKILYIKKEVDNEKINTNDDTINLSSNKHFCRR